MKQKFAFDKIGEINFSIVCALLFPMLGRLPDLFLFIPMQSTYFAFCFCLVFPPDPNKSREISTLGNEVHILQDTVIDMVITVTPASERSLGTYWRPINCNHDGVRQHWMWTAVTSLKHRKQKLRQYIYASLKMCSFGQLFSSLNIILISLELKIIGESCVIIRLNIMTIN